ncbi:MAG: UvrD-helicase domain-containing protein [Verrucomicrobia bacterium]|nr:UvrD-helicase domain-containing protein [Verrucomicrobiota bacterium]
MHKMDILAKNLLILASAGSGKTFQLGNRVIGLVAGGVAPERIVALTFTRKAAGEFADAVLTKLAHAAGSESAAAKLRIALALPDADFMDALQRVVRALPQFTLGTMDGFFSKVVRGFQYELGLTGGKFELLEAPRAAALADEARQLDWGPAAMLDVAPDAWTRQKSGLAAAVWQHLDGITYTRKGQREALETALAALANHAIGGGSLGKPVSALLESILDAVATTRGPLTVKSHKEFTIDGAAGDALRAMVELAARCELAAALIRTRAVRDLIAVYDALCEKRLRNQGLLGFDDVKILMGAWAHGENARLRREAVDFRLDARTDHWLLDEFQDTSRADWTGLLPLIDEAATDSDGTMFIVGDRKQAIYAWRGGDVRLFDEVMARYSGGLEIVPMAESWRSCPEVLALVNQVCGDAASLRELFGDAANRWDWQDHFPAGPLTQPAMRGEARVEIVGDWQQRLERLEEILRELGVGARSMTCAVLLRGNDKAREVADFLRARGFDVIEEGRREPAKDNPVGIVIAHLLKWLANPADTFAREVVEMSPLASALRARHGTSWQVIWENLTSMASQSGFAGMIEDVISDAWPAWSDFGRRRAGDLLAALATLDAQGGVSPRAAGDWIARLEVAQNPGVAAVQVMTIHKAKGLGFDVVMLQEVPDTAVPNPQYFEVAEGEGWLTQTPPKWARAILPNLREAETLWAANQQYEAFCMLYVALTRAKRGLYVLLQPPATSANRDKPSLANWLARATHAEDQLGLVYQTGTPDWVETVPMLESEIIPEAPRAPGVAIPRRARLIPSRAKNQDHAAAHSPAGVQFGSAVHTLLERVAWADESPPVLPANEVGQAVAKLLRNPALHEIFERRGRNIELFREQSADAIIEGKLLTGVIDRLLLHRTPDGLVTRVEVIDFKTDAVKDPAVLSDRYSGQMNAYRSALEIIHPNADVVCSILSVRHGSMVRM